MAAQQSAEAKPGTAPGSMALDRVMGIARAAGIKATVTTQPGTQQQLVAADQTQQESAHGRHRSAIERQWRSRLVRKSPELAARAAARAETVTSTGGSECWFKRKDSRVRRLMRLRATAVPKVRVAMLNPNRG